MDKSKVRKKNKSLLIRIITILIIVGVLLFVGINSTIENVLNLQEERLMTERLSSDIQYLQDIIGEGEWYIDDEGFLCRGKVKLGNGTDKTANIEPFIELENKTQTFSYVCKISNDKELVWVGDNKTGYQEGHYIRIAGSTRDADGKSIVGTYIDKKVSDVLDTKGQYEGEANVTGRPIFCLYQVLKDKSGKNIGCVVVGRSVEEITAATEENIRYINLALIMLLVLAFIMVFIYFKRTSDTIVSIKKYLDRIGIGDFPKEQLKCKDKDELSMVVDSINTMKESLIEKERMGSELNVAADIQVNMLPSVFPVFHESDEFDVYACMDAAREVGGDFYDFFMVDDEHVAIVIGDVSGKGVPAALFMVIAKILIKNYAQNGLEPSDIFTTVNEALCEGNETGVFVTAWMAVIDLKTGHVKYVNAGHNSPLIKSGEKYAYLKQKPGLVLAAFEDYKFTQGEFDLEEGDRIFIYTDGVTEATDSEGNMYGDDRLLSFINTRTTGELERTIHGIRRDVDRFVGDAEQFDDITMLAFDYSHMRREGVNRIEVLATPDSIGRVLNFLDNELEKLEINRKTQREIDIAIDELYSNIVRYAYPKKPGRAIISIKLDNEDHFGNGKKCLVIKLIDEGVQYNPLEKEDPDVTKDIDARVVGGLGIFISKSIMDDIEYEYSDEYNILTTYKMIE